MSVDQRLQRLWYGPGWRSVLLWPLAWLFRLLAATRRALYRIGVFPSHRVAAPVVIVGNLTVGGTGKTPVAAWLAGELGAVGHRVGIVLRGYGGHHRGRPVVVDRNSDPAVTGDEAVLHARRPVHVVVAGADRVAAAERAVEQGAQIIVCDDGLQHLSLARDCELVVVDAVRGLGNGKLLPAGPLREPASRLSGVDAVILTEREGGGPARLEVTAPLAVPAVLRLGSAVNLQSGERRSLASLRSEPIHGVAGIGNPEAFFDALSAAGLTVERTAFDDHARFDANTLDFAAGSTVLMTEKDAVKCSGFAAPNWWYVELEVQFEPEAARELLALVLRRTGLIAEGEDRG
jgi:tetraacyldisaccharide 4'-kinase